MKGLFNAALNQPLNTAIDSATVTLSGVGSKVPLTLISGTGTSVYKNGASVNSTTVSDGDKIRIRVQSSTAYATPKFGVIKIGNEEISFTVATINDPTVTFNSADDNILPIDLKKYVDGSDYTPTFSANELSLYTSTGALYGTIPLNAPTANRVKTTDAMVIADYHRDSLYLFDTSFGVLAKISTGAGSKPYGIAATKTSASDDTALTWVTLSGMNQVAVFDINHVQKFTYSTGARPLGITTSPDANHVYVANYDAGTVSHFSFNSSTGLWTSTTVTVGVKPFEIAVDSNNNAWVSCVADDKIYKITTADAVTSYATAQQGHRGLAFDKNGVLWIAAAETNAIVRMDSTGAVLGTITNAGNYPYAVAPNDDGSAMYVSCFDDSKVTLYNADGSLVRTTGVDKYPYGVGSYNGYLLVANMYSNTPNYYTPKDQSVLQFSIADPAVIKRSTVITSNTITISGLSAPVPIAIPADMWGAVILKNGTSVSTTSTVQNGDTVAIRFTSPDTYGTDVEIPILVGNFYESFVSRTESERTVPDGFAFKSIVGAGLSSVTTSNTITISGLSTSTLVPFTVDGTAIIVLNGVDQATQSINVKNGDTIALKMNSSALESTSISTKVSAGKAGTQDDGSATVPFTTTWSIGTRNLSEDNLWLKPEYLNKDEYNPQLKFTVDVASKKVARIRNKAIELLDVNDTRVSLDTSKLMIPSVFDGALYQFNGSSFDTYTASQNTPALDVAANRFVLYGTSLYDRLRDEVADLIANIGRRILYSAASDTVFVSYSGGSVWAYNVDNRGSHFRPSYTIVGGEPHAMALDSANALWVADRLNGKLTRIVAGYVATTIDTGAAGIYDIAISGNTLWTANSYDNTICQVDLTTKAVTTFKLDSAPHQIEADSDGSVWVTLPAKKSVVNIGVDGTKLSELLLSTASTYMTSFEGDIYLAQFFSDVVERQNKYTTLTPLVLNFGSTTDEARNDHVKSPLLTVSGLIRPTDAFIQMNSGYDLYVNGELVPTGKAKLWNGDKVQLDVLTPNLFYSTTVATLNDVRSVNEFSVQTESNAVPDFLAFLDIYNARPRVNVQTETLPIKGLIDGQLVLISAADEGWMLSINGAAPVISQRVKNGDTVSLVGPPHQSYSSQRTYKVTSGKHGNLCGSLTVHTFDLLGAVYNDKSIAQYGPRAQYLIGTTQNYSALVLSDKPKEWITNARATQTAQGLMFERRDRNRRIESNKTAFDKTRPRVLSGHESSQSSFIRNTVSEQNTPERSPFEKQARPTYHEFAAPLFTKFVKGGQTPQDVVVSFIKFVKGNRTEQNASISFVKQTKIQTYRDDVSKFIARSKAEQHSTNSPDFVILKHGKPKGVVPVFTRNSRHAQSSNITTWEKRKAHAQNAVTLNPFLHYAATKHFVPVDEPDPFKRTVVIRTVEMATALKQFRPTVRASAVIEAIHQERPTTKMSDVQMMTRMPRPTVKLIPAPYIKQFAPQRTFQAMSAMRNARPKDRLIDKNYSMYEYVVHQYTAVETPQTRGGWASAAEAIAAGVQAGYPNAYAVRVQSDCYVWATPVDSGDFCGITPPASQFAQPYRWHLQGG